MKLNYDNLEDAKIKLVGTYCLFKGRAVVVKVLEKIPFGENTYHAYGIYMSTGRPFECDIDDKEFNCSEYNIGYLNAAVACAWYYRLPMKQWKQGLKHDQVKAKYSHRSHANTSFIAGKCLANMLENDYPLFKDAANLLKNGEATIVAFHKNFAMTLDTIHKDYVLEYKGVNVGFTSDLKELKLMDEHEHLLEALKEAIR